MSTTKSQIKWILKECERLEKVGRDLAETRRAHYENNLEQRKKQMDELRNR